MPSTLDERLMQIEKTLAVVAERLGDTRERLFGNGAPGSGELQAIKAQIAEVQKGMKHDLQEGMDTLDEDMEKRLRKAETQIGGVEGRVTRLEKDRAKVLAWITGGFAVIMFLTGNGTVSLSQLLGLLHSASQAAPK